MRILISTVLIIGAFVVYMAAHPPEHAVLGSLPLMLGLSFVAGRTSKG